MNLGALDRADGDSPPRKARHPALVPGQGELLGALGGGAGRRADHHHRLPQPDDGAALPAHRVVHVEEEPPHPGELDRSAPRARQLGRRASGQDPRHLQSPRRESLSSARREAERAAARTTWELPAGQRAIVLPGRVGLQKHQLGVLWAMRMLARRGRWPSDVVILFAGRERDRGTSALCRRLARDPRIAGSVRFLGAVKDVRSLYWASDLLLMPSLYEGLANAALEGCAAGLPAILSHAANVDEHRPRPATRAGRSPPGARARSCAPSQRRWPRRTPVFGRWGAPAPLTWRRDSRRGRAMWSIRWWRSTTSCWRPGRRHDGCSAGRLSEHGL